MFEWTKALREKNSHELTLLPPGLRYTVSVKYIPPTSQQVKRNLKLKSYTQWLKVVDNLCSHSQKDAHWNANTAADDWQSASYEYISTFIM